MSEAIAFDTHKFVKRLTENGFTEKQAEALASEQVHLLNNNLATKAEIVKVQTALENKIEMPCKDTMTEIAATRAALETRIESTKVDLLKWMIGALIAQLGLSVALLGGMIFALVNLLGE